MNDLKVFRFSDIDIRTAYHQDGTVWFCLSDVCAVLGITNPSMVKRRLDSPYITDIEVGVTTGIKKSGDPAMQYIDMVFIGEPNLYRVIMLSKKPTAKAFQDWIYNNVIPSIRKTSSYSVSTYKLPTSYAEALRELADTVEERDKLKIEQKENKPKVAFFDIVASSDNAIDIASVAKVLNYNNIGQIKLFELLRREKILMMKKNQKNIPYQEYMNKGYFKVIESKYQINDKVKINLKTLVTQRGIQYIDTLLRSLGYKKNNEVKYERIH